MKTMLRRFFKDLCYEIDCWRYEILERVFHLSTIMEKEWSRHSVIAHAFKMYLYFIILEREEFACGILTPGKKGKYLESKTRWLKVVEDTLNRLRLDDRTCYLKSLIFREIHDAINSLMLFKHYEHYDNFKFKEIVPFIERAESDSCTLDEIGIRVSGNKRHLKLEIVG